ncbi:uncharacterized protein FOMMEDRAFT_150755 [Fomitiporia mediterranea MF3/22]|uniref:uncharacterized protein n=1 Tax=Fomitiporia mediterranea (strain MF3/22) TaxID=694068 RepID=UPI0004409CE7|nr:uncharacterized protein FOMMEDRAFT_150755 [Fomitiporia mediterranea MF3/22]EJD08083.1 hypothetical protein FOMMEDRAFT_150755 [Fomitiporia mediterranea MF3/22]
MRSSLLSAVALAITSLFTVVRAADPPPWNVLYTNDTNGAYYFLDSSQGKIVVSSASKQVST